MANWTEERKTLMLKLLDGGKSSSAVGEALGISKNAVIGKTRRMGYVLSELNGYPQERHRERPRLNQTSAQKPVRVRPMLKYKPVEPFIAESGNCTIMELTHRTCRWPLWETDNVEKFYCGAPVDSGSYCAKHWQMSKPQHVRAATETPRPFINYKKKKSRAA